MGHMLATVNPEAADAIGHEHDADQPIPDIGDTVVFHPRVGEWRAGRNKFAAIVTWVNDDGTLDLVVFYDADDFIGQRSVPRRDGEGRGWELPREMPRFFVGKAPVVTEWETVGEKSQWTDPLQEIRDRLAALEARRPPGRPKKPRPQV